MLYSALWQMLVFERWWTVVIVRSMGCCSNTTYIRLMKTYIYSKKAWMLDSTQQCTGLDAHVKPCTCKGFPCSCRQPFPLEYPLSDTLLTTASLRLHTAYCTHSFPDPRTCIFLRKSAQWGLWEIYLMFGLTYASFIFPHTAPSNIYTYSSTFCFQLLTECSFL